MTDHGQTSRIACLMRTHLRDSPKARELADALARVSGWDFYVLADETGGPVSAQGHAKLAHSVADCTRLGLNTDVQRCFWYFGDYSMYCAYHQIPHYDFYLMWDYDISVSPESPTYLQDLADILSAQIGQIDMLGTTTGPIDGPRAGRPHRFAQPYKAMFAIIGLSRRALITLYEGRLRERLGEPVANGGVHCEYYVPSLLAERGSFLMANMNDLIPGSTDRVSFNSNQARPFGFDLQMPATTHLIHPVVDLPTFLRKSFGRLAKQERTEVFLEQLERLEAQGADLATLQDFREQALQHQERVRRFARAEAIAAAARSAEEARQEVRLS